MADDKSPKSVRKESSEAGSDDESVDEREEVLLLESESEDDSDSERKPKEPGAIPKEPRENVPAIDPRLDMSLSEIVEQSQQKDVKRYENKSRANFVTGIDVTSKEARKKREDRAKRFGVAKKEEGDEKKEDISSVLLEPGSKIGGHLVRIEALHMTGVDDMSTQDIFSYFQSYDPSSIEWINDTSCNIVWLDPHSAARALLGMSKPREGYFKLGLKNLAKSRHLIDPDPVPEPDVVEQEPEPMEEGGDEDDDALDLISDSETGERVRPPSPRNSPSHMTTHSSYASSKGKDDRMDCIQPGDEDLGPIDITYDQAFRIGNPHPKSDELLIRYATQNDMKQKGAYKHSQYYIKYGNPNFGGMKGLLSETMRKKIRQGKYNPSQARKRRYHEDSDEERTEEREEWPRKRRVPGRLEGRLGGREPFRPQKQLSPPPNHHSGSDGESAEEEEEEDLEAEVRHALRTRDEERRRPKMSRRMYADDIEDQIKKIRSSMDTRPMQNTQQVVSDARDRLRQGSRGGNSRPSVKTRLGGHSFTPAPSMENLKVILDVNEQPADDEAWASRSDDSSEALVVEEDHDFEDDDDDSLSEDNYVDDTASIDSRDARAGLSSVSSDLRSRLSGRREQSPSPIFKPPQRPGFGPPKNRPAFLENLPSLQIEIREEV